MATRIFFFSYHDPGSAKSRSYARKSAKRGFSQKGLTRFQKFCSIWVPVKSNQDWRPNLESAYSLMVHYCKKIVGLVLPSNCNLGKIFALTGPLGQVHMVKELFLKFLHAEAIFL